MRMIRQNREETKRKKQKEESKNRDENLMEVESSKIENCQKIVKEDGKIKTIIPVQTAEDQRKHSSDNEEDG